VERKKKGETREERDVYIRWEERSNRNKTLEKTIWTFEGKKTMKL